MQIVQVAGSPVPTVVRLIDLEESSESAEVYIETTDDEVVTETPYDEVFTETTDDEVFTEKDITVPAPAIDEDVPNSSETLKAGILLASVIFGALFYLGV